MIAPPASGVRPATRLTTAGQEADMEILERNTRELESIARAMTAPGHGILAADESNPTIAKRFAAIHVESTEENRRAYRELLLTAPGLGEHIGGVILFEETLHQATAGGVPFVEVLEKAGIVPGVKVDKGTVPLAGFSGEKITEGLDGLRERLAAFRTAGARFVKWRAVVRIGPEMPTRTAVHANAHALARYAALAQEAGLVPIVEPEVLMDGDHSLARCETVTGQVLNEVFAQLFAHRVLLEGMVLKPNMVLAGEERRARPDPYEVAEATVRCLEGHVPAAVQGIAFLSGGQSEAEATLHLDLINRVGRGPWRLTFSYGRALQHTALLTWAGKEENRDAAQRALLDRARLVGLARAGRYEASMEPPVG
jgi:fructose-bisphosphate aldolase class I